MKNSVKPKKPADSLTSDKVQKVFNYMCKKYDFKVVEKCNKWNHIAHVFRLMGVKKISQWLSSYTMTVYKTIYTHYSIGNSEDKPLSEQLDNLAHEMTHVLQERDSFLKFIFRYFGSKSKRAKYEYLAIRAQMEMRYYLEGTKASSRYWADKLKPYMLRSADLIVCRIVFAYYNRHLSKGPKTIAAKEIIKYLKVIG